MQKRLLFCACLGLFCAGNGAAQTRRSMGVDELFALVETGSKALKTQKTGVDVARGGIEEARSRRLPEISASLAASYNGNVLMTDRSLGNARGLSQPHFGNSFAIEAQQVVYAGGAISSGIRIAELQREQSENGVEMTRCRVRFVALGQYLELLKLENGIKVYDSNIALTEKLIADIKSRQAQGMALKNDVTRYELQMESLKLGRRRLEDQKSIMNHQLCNTLGMEEAQIVPSMQLDTLEEEHRQESELQAEAAGNSLLMQQAALGLSMAEQQLRLAKSELMPKVAIVAADNFAGPFTYDIPPIDKNFNTWYVGVGVKYNISSLFKGNKGVRKAKEQLRQSDAVTKQQYDQIHTNYLAAKARYEQSVRSRATLTRTEQEQGHRLSQNRASVRVAQAQIQLAKLNLSYTVIIATADGVVGKKNIHVGQLVQPGQAMVDIVDSSELWVVANYRETQLPGIRVGSRVRVTADAVPGVEFEGRVERISDATGAAFSVIPQDNATGNFVKVEQRIPVRIHLEGGKEKLGKLRAGMNVECTIKK